MKGCFNLWKHSKKLL